MAKYGEALFGACFVWTVLKGRHPSRGLSFSKVVSASLISSAFALAPTARCPQATGPSLNLEITLCEARFNKPSWESTKLPVLEELLVQTSPFLPNFWAQTRDYLLPPARWAHGRMLKDPWFVAKGFSIKLRCF